MSTEPIKSLDLDYRFYISITLKVKGKNMPKKVNKFQSFTSNV